MRGLATINESAVTGESAPVLREAGTDRSGVIGGTKVLSDEIIIRVTAEPGHSFLDRMIALVEGANRQKTPNEIALTMLLAAMTLTFLIVVATLPVIGAFVGAQVDAAAADRAAGVPDPDHHRRPVAGDRHRRHEPRAVGERAGEIRQGGGSRGRRRRAAARQDRHDHPRRPPGDRVPSAGRHRCLVLREAALLSSLADPTPEGKSIVKLAREQGCTVAEPERADYLQFTAQTRMSGVDLERRGATR